MLKLETNLSNYLLFLDLTMLICPEQSAKLLYNVKTHYAHLCRM